MAAAEVKREKVKLSAADDFFRALPYERTWTNSYTLTFNPTAAIDEHRVNFEVPKLSPPNFFYPGGMEMLMEFKLVDEDGEKPADNSIVAPINLFPETMLRSVRIFLNDMEVSNSENGAYALRAYMYRMTSASASAKMGILQAYGYYPDLQGDFDTTGAPNHGFTSRMALFSTTNATNVTTFSNESVFAFSKIFSDFTGCDLPVIPGVGCRVEVLFNDPKFYMMTNVAGVDSGYRLKVCSARLLVPVRTLNAGLNLDLEDELAKKAIKYSLVRVEIKKITLSATQQSFTADSLKQSSLSPDKIQLLLIPEGEWEGNYLTNPLELRHTFGSAKLSRCNTTLNGASLEDCVVSNNRELVIANYRRAYKTMGHLDRTLGVTTLSRLEFENGYFSIDYDLTQSGRAYKSALARQPTKEGSLRVELGFSEPLAGNVSLFVLSWFHSAVEIDKSRNVLYKYVD